MQADTGYLELDSTFTSLNLISRASSFVNRLFVRITVAQNDFEKVEIQSLIEVLSRCYAEAQQGNLYCKTIVLLPTSLEVELEEDLIEVVFEASPSKIHSSRLDKGLPPIRAIKLESSTQENLPQPPLEFRYAERSTVHTQRTPRVALGGTFDRLHAGHKVLLSVASVVASSAIITGLTDGVLLANKKFLEMMEPFQTRKENLEKFLHFVNPKLGLETVALVDVGGPTLSDPTITGLVASQETEKNAAWINEQRTQKGMNVLLVTIITLVENHSSLAQDAQNKISSTSLREAAWRAKQATL